MTDREKLTIALMSEESCHSGGEVSVSDVVSMLHALGAEHRRVARRELVLTTV